MELQSWDGTGLDVRGIEAVEFQEQEWGLLGTYWNLDVLRFYVMSDEARRNYPSSVGF